MTTATATGGKVIVKFFKKTVCGSLYNEGEVAAFDEATAKLLTEGGVLDEDSEYPTKVKASATVVRRLTAEQVAKEEAAGQASPSTLTIDTRNMNAETLKKLQALLKEQKSAE